MKKVFLLFIAAFITEILIGQDCQNFYYLTDKAVIEMTVYDRKGEATGRQQWKVTDVKSAGNGYTSHVASTFTDAKGKEGVTANGVFRCENGVFQADMRMAMPQQQMEAYKDMEVKADEVYIEYPHNMASGQKLKDGTFKMEIYNKDALATTLNYTLANRVVEGKEKVTTPAGSWDAYKISYEGQMKTMIGGIGIPINFKIIEWFVPGFGIVKTESYSKNDKLMGSTLVTSIKK